MTVDWLKKLRMAMTDAVEADAAAADRRIGEILAEVLPQLEIDREVVAVAVTALATDRDAAIALAKLVETWWQLGQSVGRRRKHVADLRDHMPAQQGELLARELRQARRDHAALAYALCLVTAQLAGTQDGAGPAAWFASWQASQRRERGGEDRAV